MGINKKEKGEEKGLNPKKRIIDSLKKEKSTRKTQKKEENQKTNKKILDSETSSLITYTNPGEGEKITETIKSPPLAEFPLRTMIPKGLINNIKPGTVAAKELIEIEALGYEAIWDKPPPKELTEFYKQWDIEEIDYNIPIPETGDREQEIEQTITREQIPEFYDRENNRYPEEYVQYSNTEEETEESLDEELEEWLGLSEIEKKKSTFEAIMEKNKQAILKAEEKINHFNAAKIATLNINGSRNKWDKIDDILQNERLDILIITETHLPEFVTRRFENINRKYKATSYPGTKENEHYKGGTTMFISRKMYKLSEINHGAPKNTIHISIKEPISYEIIGYYAPSGHDTKEFYTKLREYMEGWKENNYTEGFIIAGDSNATINPATDRWTPHGETHQGTPADKAFREIMLENENRSNFIDTLPMERKRNYSFIRYKAKTFETEIHTQSRIDHILIEDTLNNKMKIKKAEITNKYDFSDHRMVTAELEWDKNAPNYPEIPKYHIPRFKTNNLDNAELKALIGKAICPPQWTKLEKKLNYEREITQEELDEIHQKTIKEITSAVSRNIPKTKPPKPRETKTYANHPRIRKIRKAIRTIKYNLQKIRKRNKTNRPHNPDDPGTAMGKAVNRIIATIENKEKPSNPFQGPISAELLINLKTKLNNKRSSYITKKETEKGVKLKELAIKWYHKNPRRFYNMARGGKKRYQEMEVLINEEGKRIFLAKDKILHTHNHYTKLFTHTDKEIKKGSSIKHLFPKDAIHPPKTDLTYPTDIEEVKKKLKETANGKAPGPDNITYEIWRNLPEEFAEALKITYNIALEKKIIPKRWNDSYLKPIFKNKGSPSDLLYYRPISLLQTEYKIFTSIITDRLSEYMEENHLFSKIQCGFRKNKGCLDAVFTLVSSIEVATRQKLEMHIVTLDAKNAFDTVPREAKYEALDFQVKDQNLNQIIKKLYQDINTKVITPFGETEIIELKKGVRQGDTLSPLLFLIFLNPLLLRLEKMEGIKIHQNSISALATADDIALIGKNRETTQKLIKTTLEYFDSANMRFNGEKSNHSYMNAPKQDRLKIGESYAKDLGDEGFCRYLGFTFNMKLDWGKQQKITINAWRNLINIFLKKRMFTTAKIDVINTLANTLFSYNMCLIKYKKKDLEEMDNLLLTGIKREIGISSRANRATLTAPKEKGGRGLTLPSKIQEQTTVNAIVNLLINKEDDSIATDLVRSIIRKEGTQKTSLSTVKNLKTTLKKNGLSCKLGIKKSEGIWTEIGKSYRPKNKWDEDRPHYTEKDRKGKETVWIWTDGSVFYEKKKLRGKEIKIPKAGAAIYLKEGQHELIPSDFGNDSGYAELKAIEVALLSAPWERIRILTDSKSSIDDIQLWKTYRNVTIRRHKYREILKRITELVKTWEKEGRRIEFTHVRSHIEHKLKSKNRKQVQRTKKWIETTKSIFGNKKYHDIVEGNEKADELAKKAAKMKGEIYNIPANNDFLVILEKGRAVEGSAHALIKKRFKIQEPKKWKSNFLTLNKEEINEALSWPQYRKITYGKDKDTNFLTKLRRENLKTRREVHRCKPQPHYQESYKIKWEALYSSPQCIFCDSKEEESSRHLYIKCEKWKEKRLELHHLTQLLIKKHFNINGFVSWIFDRKKLIDNMRTLYRNQIKEETLLRLMDMDEKEMMRVYFPKPLAEIVKQVRKAEGLTKLSKKTEKEK